MRRVATNKRINVAFWLIGIFFLLFLFSRRGQDIFAVITGRAVTINGTAYWQYGIEKYKDENGTPMLRMSDGTFVKSGEIIPGFGKPFIPSVRDMPQPPKRDPFSDIFIKDSTGHTYVRG